MDDDKLDRMLEVHANCTVCERPAEVLRRTALPVWGLDEKGRERKQIGPWLDEVTENDPDVEGRCMPHLQFSPDGDGGWHDPRQPIKKGNTGNYFVRAKEEREKVRREVIEKLGGQCQRCKGVFPSSEMRLRVPERSRRELDITTRTEWYRFLLERPKMLEQAVLLCLACDLPQGSADPGRKLARDVVIKYLGGQCLNCPRTEGLMIVALKGTRPLVWPNGDKYTSTAKAQYLARRILDQKSVSGWGLACGKHQNDIQQGRVSLSRVRDNTPSRAST